MTKTTTTVVNTTTSSTTTALAPVTQATTSTTTTVTQTAPTIPGTTEGYDPIAPLVALLGGSQGFPSTLEQLICPPVTEAAELLASTGFGVVGDGLTTLACRAGMLEYRFFTRFPVAGGDPVEREHIATLGVPTPLDVDNDVEPDLIGTITLTGVNSVGLVIDRSILQTTPLPVSVEAVLRDPTRGSLGREQIAFGYDARHDAAPGRFVLSTAIDTLLQPTPDFNVSIAQETPGQKIALIAGIFDGTPRARVNPAEVRLDYGRSPTSATIHAQVGGDESVIALTTAPTGPAEVSGRIVDGTDEQRFAARIADLPDFLQVNAGQAGGVSGAISSSAPIGRIDGSFERLQNTGPEPLIAQKAVFDLQQVPVGVNFQLSGDTGSVTTTGGPIGHVRVGSANGEPVFLVGQNAYVNVHEQGPLKSVAAAIPGLRSASFTLGDAPQVSAEIAPTPFLVRLTEPGRTLGLDILDLPARFDLGLDMAAGRITYDGHGSGIGRIVLAGDSAEPFFARATKLRATIEDIPAAMTARFSTDAAGGAFEIDGGAIGRLELLASDGSEETPAGSGQGVVYRDVTDGAYVVSARILGLRRVAFSNGDAVSLETHTAGGPFTVLAQTDTLTANARIADLPAKAAVTAALDGGRLTYSGRTADDQPVGIDSFDLDLASTGALFGRADHVDAHIEDIPADLTLALGQDGGGLDLTASDPIGLVEVVAREGAIADPQGDLPAAGEQGAKFTDLTGGDYVVAARVRELKRLAGSFGQAMQIDAETAGGPFGIRLATDDLAGDVRIEDLPRKLQATFDLAAGQLELHGRDAGDQPQGIERVLIDLDGAGAVFGRATDLHGRIEQIPSDLTLELAPNAGGVSLDADNPIGLIELVADSQDINDAASLLPADGHQGAVYRDTADRFLMSARIRQLRKLDADLAGSIGLRAITAGGPFSLLVDANGLQADGRILDLPPDVEISFDPAQGGFSYRGRDAAGGPQGTELVTIDISSAEPLLGRATRLSTRIEDLADSVDLVMDPDAAGGPAATVDASTPISKLEVLATDGATTFPAPLDDPAIQGAVIIDRAGQPYALGLRVLELKRLALSTGDDMGVEALTAGGPFAVQVDMDDFAIDADVLDLPPDAKLGVNLETGEITFDGKAADGTPRGIDLLTLDGRLAEPVLGGANRISARIERLPSSVTVGFSQAGGNASITANEPIQLVEVFGWTDGNPKPVLAADQGARLQDRTGEPFELAARIRELRELSVSFADGIGLTARTAGGPFAVDLDTDDFEMAGRVLDLPPTATLAFDLDSGQITFDGKAADGTPKGIDLLTLDGRMTDPILGGAERISARIEKLPGTVSLGFSSTDGTASLNASSPIQLIELFGWEDGQPKPTLAADQGARLHDRAGSPFELAARVRQLEQLTVDFTGAMQLTTKTAGGLFDADIKTETLTAKAIIDQLPTELSLNFDLASGQVNYTGSAPINRIFAAIDSTEELFMGATALEVDLKQVPQVVNLGLGTETQNISISTDNPIGQIDVKAKSPNRAYPAVPVGEAGAIFDSTGGELALALRVFALKNLNVSLDPMALSAEMQGGRKFLLDANIEQDDGSVGAFDGVIDQLPAKVDLALTDNVVNGVANGSKLTLNGSAPIGFVRIAAQGIELLPGADKVEAEINSIPEKLTVLLPETGSLARVESRNLNNVATAIGQIRLAASDGSKALPALVSDAQYNSNPSNAAFRDLLEFSNTATSSAVALRLTAPKVIDVNLDPIALTLEQDGSRTRPIALNASIPNDTGPPATVTGLVNKPTAFTSVGVTLPVADSDPTQLNFQNGTSMSQLPAERTMGSLSLNITNLGDIPSANVSVTNVPHRFTACLATTGACRPADRLPTALTNYTQSTSNDSCRVFGVNTCRLYPDSSQNATAGGMNRPYPAMVSLDFNDLGTSGTSAAISSMITLNATIDLGQGDPPVKVQNLRFHRVALDLGLHPTGQTFPYLFGTDVPKMYLFIDSNALPFVMNRIEYKPEIDQFTLGNDTSPANGNKRLVWVPGRRSTSAVTTTIDNRVSGSLNCGGARVMETNGLNLLDLFGVLGEVINVCS